MPLSSHLDACVYLWGGQQLRNKGSVPVLALGATPSRVAREEQERPPRSSESVVCLLPKVVGGFVGSWRSVRERLWGALAALSARGFGSVGRSVCERYSGHTRGDLQCSVYGGLPSVCKQETVATRFGGSWLRHSEQCPWRWGGGFACSQRGLSVWGSSPRQRRLRRS